MNNSLKSHISYEKQVLGNCQPLSTYSDYLSLFLSHLEVIPKSALVKVLLNLGLGTVLAILISGWVINLTSFIVCFSNF